MSSDQKFRIWLVVTRVLILFLLFCEALNFVNKSPLFKNALVSRHFWELVMPTWLIILFLAIFSFLPLYWKHRYRMIRADVILFLIAIAGILFFQPLAFG